MESMADPVFDVCIVGSGPGGGIATYVLARAGLKVALVEAGGRLRPGVDYDPHRSPYEHLEQRLQAGRRPGTPSVNDFAERGHFTPVGDRPGHGLLKALGGRSLCWAGHSLRFGPIDFRRWPISYDEVAPYYSRVERLMGVHGNRDRLSNLPDGEFMKGVPLRCGEQMLKRGVERLKRQGRRMEFVAQRKAILTERHPSRRPVCHYCGHCMAGCEVDAKYTSANTAIPAAERTGNLTLFLSATMTRILTAEGGRRVLGIEYADAAGRREQVRCRALVLACGAIETARQLLANTGPGYPDGLANSSGQVGRNLSSHFGFTVTGIFPQLRGRDASNDDGTDYYHSLLTGLCWDRPSPNFEGTYQVQCGAGLHPRSLAVRNVPGWGSAFKRDLRDWNAWHASMGMQGSLLISPRKFVDLDPDRRDALGTPLPRIHLHYEDSDVAMAQDMLETCEEIIRAAGGRVTSSPGQAAAEKLVIDSNHWVGTARMGTNPRESVVNLSGQCHDVPNLFLSDASVFAANPEKNPTLSNMALSWRTSDRIVEKFRSREIA
jgi:choline dehydrogenase-like flavoprotein